MNRVYSSLFISFLCISNNVVSQNYDWYSNFLWMNDYSINQQPQDTYFTKAKTNVRTERVDLKLYYEVLCPDCIDLDRTQFKHIVNVLSPYLTITTYPYGNAQTIEKNGKVQFKCQHGPKECYGNKLHACTLQHITNHRQALLFNICMMEPNNKTRGSDDASATRCSREMRISKNAITQCAKGQEGNQLLKYYGEESRIANFEYVPYVLINGLEWKGTDLMHDVCAAFHDPPGVCFDNKNAIDGGYFVQRTGYFD
ncbi:GILT-like protein 2 [Plodia interpunctella]|uniref:GILT-like protein 2 n=1 Tax=Plodia interpunctella TaxID=58824 RepID=UPI002368DBB2|nr:GILT-like protein 2 [Plodia interpunctella]